MAGPTVPHFINDQGVATIEIGVREFQCMGATPPQDHPHIYLDMGHEDEILCPYCSTHFKFNETLAATETRPEGCFHK